MRSTDEEWHLGFHALRHRLVHEENVPGGEVAVDNPVRVHVRHPLAHLNGRREEGTQLGRPILVVILSLLQRSPQGACVQICSPQGTC